MKAFDPREFVQNSVMRMTKEEAIEFVEKNDMTLRVVKHNGVPCVVTRDYFENRLNVALLDDMVSETLGWG